MRAEDAIDDGHVRDSGDFSKVSLRLGGFIQSVFLMRDALEARGLLDKYTSVLSGIWLSTTERCTRHSWIMPGASLASGMRDPLPARTEVSDQCGWSEIVCRLFLAVLLADRVGDRADRHGRPSCPGSSTGTLHSVPGVQATIKPDGTGFHHGTAYVGAYGPYAIGAFAQLLYMLDGTTFYSAGQRRCRRIGNHGIPADGSEVCDIRGTSRPIRQADGKEA